MRLVPHVIIIFVTVSHVNFKRRGENFLPYFPDPYREATIIDTRGCNFRKIQFFEEIGSLKYTSAYNRLFIETKISYYIGLNI